MIWLLLAICCDRMQLYIASRNYGSTYNGIGAIDSVLARTAAAPMAYRVLVPWLVGLAERIYPPLRKHRFMGVYEPLKIALMALTFWACSLAIGTPGALLVAVMLQATYQFDYWSFAPEMTGLALALTGNPMLACAGAVMAALSKPETSPLVAVTYLLVTWDWLGAATVGVCVIVPWALVRLWAGNHKLYCARWTWRKNVAAIRGMMKLRPPYMSNMAMSLGITALTLWVVIMGQAGSAWPVPLVMLGASWTMALCTETRVLAPCLIWIAGGLLCNF